MNVLRVKLAAASAAGIFSTVQAAAVAELVEFHEGGELPEAWLEAAFAELMEEQS